MTAEDTLPHHYKRAVVTAIDDQRDENRNVVVYVRGERDDANSPPIPVGFFSRGKPAALSSQIQDSERAELAASLEPGMNVEIGWVTMASDVSGNDWNLGRELNVID